MTPIRPDGPINRLIEIVRELQACNEKHGTGKSGAKEMTRLIGKLDDFVEELIFEYMNGMPRRQAIRAMREMSFKGQELRYELQRLSDRIEPGAREGTAA